MKIFGLTISRTVEKDLSPVSGRGGWWPVIRESFTALKELLVQGDMKYIEKDQFSDVPRAIHEASGQLHVSNWGENTGDFNKRTLEFIPYTKPTVKTRKD